MIGEPEFPGPNQPKRPRKTLAGAYVGFVTFGALNVLAFLVMSNALGAPGLPAMALVGGGLLAVVIALAACAYWGWDPPGFAAGLLGGYALMTIISGGPVRSLCAIRSFRASTLSRVHCCTSVRY